MNGIRIPQYAFILTIIEKEQRWVSFTNGISIWWISFFKTRFPKPSFHSQVQSSTHVLLFLKKDSYALLKHTFQAADLV